MKYKKHFNNLFDSICISLLFLVGITFYIFVIWYGVINPKEGTNPVVALITATILFGIINISCILILFIFCYEYWVLSDDSICSKKIFRRKVTIKLNEIDKVEKKEISAFVMGTYKSQAYIIHSKNKRVVVLLQERKKYNDLDQCLAPFIVLK